jgi:hypothetical protein
LQHDLTPGRVTDPVRRAQEQVSGERGKVTSVVGDRQMAGWLTSRIPRAANADHATRVQGTALADGQEPVGKYARMDKDDRLANAPVRVPNLAPLD